MLRKLLLFMILLLIAVLVGGFFLPKVVQVSRSTTIQAPPWAIYPVINDLERFNQYSPWANLDPDAEYAVSDPSVGEGAWLTWEGRPETLGSGRIEIINSDPDERVSLDIAFNQAGPARSIFLLHPMNEETRVSWSFRADVTDGRGVLDAILARYAALFMDDSLARDYDIGLANLKRVVETLPVQQAASLAPEIVQLEAGPMIFVSGETSQQNTDLSAELAEAFRRLDAYTRAREFTVTGPPMAITRYWDERGFGYDAALPVAAAVQSGDQTEPEEPPILVGNTPAGRVLHVVHQGPYGELLNTYQQIEAYMQIHGLEQRGVSWEAYPGLLQGREDGTDRTAESLPSLPETHIYIQLDGPSDPVPAEP